MVLRRGQIRGAPGGGDQGLGDPIWGVGGLGDYLAGGTVAARRLDEARRELEAVVATVLAPGRRS